MDYDKAFRVIEHMHLKQEVLTTAWQKRKAIEEQQRLLDLEWKTSRTMSFNLTVWDWVKNHDFLGGI